MSLTFLRRTRTSGTSNITLKGSIRNEIELAVHRMEKCSSTSCEPKRPTTEHRRDMDHMTRMPSVRPSMTKALLCIAPEQHAPFTMTVEHMSVCQTGGAPAMNAFVTKSAF